jgi:hypothetical protein
MAEEKPKDKIEILMAENGEYYWHQRSAGNNKIVLTPGETFTTKKACLESIERKKVLATVVDLTDQKPVKAPPPKPKPVAKPQPKATPKAPTRSSTRRSGR